MFTSFYQVLHFFLAQFVMCINFLYFVTVNWIKQAACGYCCIRQAAMSSGQNKMEYFFLFIRLFFLSRASCNCSLWIYEYVTFKLRSHSMFFLFLYMLHNRRSLLSFSDPSVCSIFILCLCSSPVCFSVPTQWFQSHQHPMTTGQCPSHVYCLVRAREPSCLIVIYF